jgi:hypothetical protein
MTENNMVPASLMEEIRSLKESMDRITSFILELKHDYAVLEENLSQRSKKWQNSANEL